MENTLDLLIIVMAAAALVVGGYAAYQLFFKKQANGETPVAPAKPAAAPAPAKPAPVPPVPSASPASKTIFDTIAKPAASHQPAQPDFLPPAAKSFPVVGFTAESLRLESASRLVLALRNDGPKMIFKRVAQGPDNEVTVTHVLDSQPLKTLLPEYPTGSSLFLHLDADNVISRTFQFTIYYGDLQGNLFRQDVSGLGKEYPIVEPANPIQ